MVRNVRVQKPVKVRKIVRKKDEERKKKYPFAFELCAGKCGKRLRHDAKTDRCLNCGKQLRALERVKASKEAKKKPSEKVSVKKALPRKKKKAPKPEPQRRSRVAIVMDHSGSMRRLVKSAIQDFNNTVDVIRESAGDQGIQTLASVVRFGLRRPPVQVAQTNVPLSSIPPLQDYIADGMTPLYDGVMKAIDLLETSPQAKDLETSFLVTVITDGQENYSQTHPTVLRKRLEKLQSTDRWTFVFRVPPGYGHEIRQNLGLYAGNIQEWEISDKGLAKANQVHVQSMGSYYGDVARGKTSTRSFFEVDVSQVNTAVLKQNMRDIASEVEMWFVKDSRDGSQIRDFCVRNLKGERFSRGSAFYLLERKNKAVVLQEYKKICIRNPDTGEVFGGPEARNLLGIPPGRYKLKAGDHGKWEIYVQSTSTNRKLFTGDRVLYWRAAAR